MALAATIQAAGDFAQAAADKVWSTSTRALTDKVGFALSSAGVQAIWDALTSALTTVGSVGKLLADNVNATISSRSSHSAADVWASATRLLTAGTNIVLAKGTGVTGFNDLSAAQVNTEADTALADYDGPTSAELDARTLVAASYATAAGQTTIAGYIDTEVSAILAAVDTEVAAIKAKTDTLPAAPAATGDIPTAVQNADALLDRVDAVEVGLTPRQALRLTTAASAGKLSGASTATVTIRNAVADSKNRVVATVDGAGNRSAITTDLT